MKCGWAPTTHEAEATTMLHFERVCGHHKDATPSCTEHVKPVGTLALGPSTCATCGMSSHVYVAKHTRIRNRISPNWAFMKPFDIYANDGSGDIYLHRLRILQTPWFAVYLHDINLPDNDRDPHDHPWSFWSLVVRGGYRERLWLSPSDYVYNRALVRRYSAGSLHRMSTNEAHMILDVEPRTKTLVFAGRRTRVWGFWTDRGFVTWDEYLR